MKYLMSEEFDLFRLCCENKNDVFLIYSAEYFFGSSMLYESLCQRKINTYEYKINNLWNEKRVLEKLRQSKIIIIVFSKDFAEATTCLDLLAYIIDNVPELYFQIIPVFNGVVRSDLEHQTGNYAEAFTKHQLDNSEKVNKWREALKKVSILPSWRLGDVDFNINNVLGQIQNVVSSKVDRIVLDCSYFRGLRNGFATVTAYISPPYESSERDHNHDLAPCQIPLLNEVGIDSRLKEVLSLMQFELDRVLFVGIHGGAGIGKTTLARKIYNMIADHFDASCFIPRVGENSRKYGLERLQDKILFELTGVIYEKIPNVAEGNEVIPDKLWQKKVLLILDNVDAVDQLDALAEKPYYFGTGSIIIITTQNEEVLRKYDDITKYNVSALDYTNALNLLHHQVMKEDLDPKDIHFFNPFVDCASGNPMNLKQIGSALFGRPMELWRDVLQEIQLAGGVAQWVATIRSCEAVEPRQSRQGFGTTVPKFLLTNLLKIWEYIPDWKIFGLLSSLVLLPCYALNPSIKHLIGGWVAWKIFLYVMLSFYVMYNMLLATEATIKAIYLRYKVFNFLALFFIAIYTHNLLIQVWTIDKRFIILVIIFGFILYCKKTSPPPRIRGLREL